MYINTTLSLYTTAEGHVDDSGNYVDGQETYMADVDGDLQPYSTELLLKTYGYDIETTNRFITESDADIKIGMYFKDGDKKYIVQKIIPWDTYKDIALKEVK